MNARQAWIWMLFVGATTLRLDADVFNLPAGQTSLQFVPVGNAGNAGQLSGAGAGGVGADAVVGAVAYAYQIGKFEVTAGQYTAFLNAVAKTDIYDLYHPFMADPTGGSGAYGCNIQRLGTPGNYSYTVAADWANRPVNYVSWGDAARFANWLTNGQPVGEQDATTTEDGSYALLGAIRWPELNAVVRKASARYVIPSEHEWYKAAYFDPNKPGGAGYWAYPTRSDSTPSNEFSATATNSTNHFVSGPNWSIGSPYWRTEVGAYAASPSAYGTFDQGGNVWEWNEAFAGEFFRYARGGSFGNQDVMYGSYRNYYSPPDGEGYELGFRIALVPEPSMAWLLLAGVTLLRRSGFACGAGSGNWQELK